MKKVDTIKFWQNLHDFPTIHEFINTNTSEVI